MFHRELLIRLQGQTEREKEWETQASSHIFIRPSYAFTTYLNLIFYRPGHLMMERCCAHIKLFSFISQITFTVYGRQLRATSNLLVNGQVFLFHSGPAVSQSCFSQGEKLSTEDGLVLLQKHNGLFQNPESTGIS